MLLFAGGCGLGWCCLCALVLLLCYGGWFCLRGLLISCVLRGLCDWCVAALLVLGGRDSVVVIFALLWIGLVRLGVS